MPAARGLALTSTKWMIDRVHRDAAHVRAFAEPAAAAGLANRHVLVIEVADLADGRDAFDVDLADLAGRHLHRGVFTLARHRLHRRARAAGNLAAFARAQLHVVDLRAERDIRQRQAVARQDVDVVARYHHVADLNARWLQDVSLLAVRVGHERDARRAVRVVFDRLDAARNVLLVALEVDDPVEALVTTAAPP